MAARQLHPNGTVDLLDLPDHFLPEVAAGIIRQAVKEAERDLADDYTHVRQVLESRLLSSERWLSPEDMREAAETGPRTAGDRARRGHHHLAGTASPGTRLTPLLDPTRPGTQNPPTARPHGRGVDCDTLLPGEEV
jgi:hypothetical protein